MEGLKTCSRCHSDLLDEYFSKNRKGEFQKCCNNCLNRFKCDLCEYKTSRNNNLKKHIKQVHDKIKDVLCNLCDFKCSTNGHLQRHIKQVHNKIKDVQCDKCDFKCSTNSDLTRHIKQVHDKIKDFECEICDYKCSRNSDLKQHISTCTGKVKCSSGELKIMNILDELKISYVYNEQYDGLKDKTYLRWDFRILSDEPIFIEYDGKGHYLPIRWSSSMTEDEAKINLDDIKKRDKLKNDYCDENGYLILRIPYWEKENITKIVVKFLYENTIF